MNDWIKFALIVGCVFYTRWALRAVVLGLRDTIHEYRMAHDPDYAQRVRMEEFSERLYQARKK